MTTIETNPNTPPAGFVSHVLKDVDPASEGFQAQLRAVITETWSRARQDDTADLQAAVFRYMEVEHLLERKLERVRMVIRNTINKRNLETPARFQWVHGWHSYAVSGFYRNMAASYQSPRYKPLFILRLAGMLDKIDRNDLIKIKPEMGREDSAFIPFHWLSLSDGELSKMVRNEVRQEAAKKKSEKLKTLIKEKEMVAKNLRKLESQIAELSPQKS